MPVHFWMDTSEVQINIYLCDCIDDDFKAIAEKVIAAYSVTFASPTYMFGMSGTLKRFLERWISLKMPPTIKGLQ